MKQLQHKPGEFECQEKNETNLTNETVATILCRVREKRNKRESFTGHHQQQQGIVSNLNEKISSA